MQWVDKYKPKKSSEIQGQDTPIRKLRHFLEGGKGGAIIYGAVGNGKSSSVYALAKELNREVLEVNASDVRNKDGINSVVGEGSKQMSLFGRNKVILVDEVDSLSGKDRGGVQALTALIKDSGWPIVFTANDPWDSKLNSLRKECLMIEFGTLNYLSVFNVLKRIANEEGISFNDGSLKTLARRSNGDLRAAINDLQCLGHEGNVDDLEIDDREIKEGVFNVLKVILKSRSIFDSLNITDKSEVELDELFLWLEENIGYEYRNGADVSKGYDMLSKADVFRGRIRRWQYWRFLVYQKFLMSAGVSLSKKERYSGFFTYKRNTRILSLWQANMKYAKRKLIAEKLGEKTHLGVKKAVQELGYLKYAIIKNPEIAKELELSNEEIEWLKK